MTNLTEADVVRIFNDAGLTIDIRGSLRVTHKTGTFEDEDDSGVYIAMHQDTIKKETARAARVARLPQALVDRCMQSMRTAQRATVFGFHDVHRATVSPFPVPDASNPPTQERPK